MERLSLSTTLLTAALAFGAHGNAASATEHAAFELKSPMAGATLREGDIDMSVYYLEHETHFEVVATYITLSEPYEPERFALSLQDGNAVDVTLPGHEATTFRFERFGSSVTVAAKVTQAQLE